MDKTKKELTHTPRACPTSPSSRNDGENKKSAKERKKPMAVAPIAKPLAGKNLCKRTLSSSDEAKSLKRGVKEVVKSVRRGHKGLCVIAGNISPIDVITHVPILLEEADIPYIYVPSEEDLAVSRGHQEVLTKPNKRGIGPRGAREVEGRCKGLPFSEWQ
ncbi:H ACA ribonucleoprotein complex subunit [Musa troglodytarum]|uniref:H ACA ribonucleoprotein complex subunit n=1 Tax=Musa troglodytarum TaxID=320322 RepID=A0A9E7HLN8_9LILI|nr:H ACA ribonucleoprotein complex subunit [Musa troglodytarum]